MREGELWVFNNKVVHSAENVSDQIRVHLIFDIKPKNNSGYFVQSEKSNRDTQNDSTIRVKQKIK